MMILLDFYHLSNIILGYYLRESHAQQSITRDNKHKYFPWGNHKGETPPTSSEIESTPKLKPQNSNMISRQQ